MRYVTYRDRYIVASGAFDELARNYYPVASISWQEPSGAGHVHIIRDVPEHRATLEDACNLAVELARVWVDRKLSPGKPSEE
jgi:hypothetical protein